MKTVLITGITGQDGSFLSEFLIGGGVRSIWTDPTFLRGQA